ncbi:MAG: hypothetical protein M1829_006932 [Trizodia sp. TS-e1964]|nr:MAG: hypothetical protein M1829_006932 [Trizodia sp. TS-e1964]
MGRVKKRKNEPSKHSRYKPRGDLPSGVGQLKNPGERLSYSSNQPPYGYEFVPKGDIYVIKNCRKLSQEAGLSVYVVLDRTRTKTVGLHVAQHIHRKVLQGAHETAEKREYQVALKDSREINNARNTLKERFPFIPISSAETILRHGFLKGSGRVGRSKKLPLWKKIDLATIAHVRHTFTKYDEILRNNKNEKDPRTKARQQVRETIFSIIRKWRTNSTTSLPNQTDAWTEMVVQGANQQAGRAPAVPHGQALSEIKLRQLQSAARKYRKRYGDKPQLDEGEWQEFMIENPNLWKGYYPNLKELILTVPLPSKEAIEISDDESTNQGNGLSGFFSDRGSEEGEIGEGANMEKEGIDWGGDYTAGEESDSDSDVEFISSIRIDRSAPSISNGNYSEEYTGLRSQEPRFTIEINRRADIYVSDNVLLAEKSDNNSDVEFISSSSINKLASLGGGSPKSAKSTGIRGKELQFITEINRRAGVGSSDGNPFMQTSPHRVTRNSLRNFQRQDSTEIL